MSDILSNKNKPEVDEYAAVSEVIIEISSKRVGATAVTTKNKLRGIITDGDLRRMLETGGDLKRVLAKDIMNKIPKMIEAESLAYDALKIMEGNNINQIVVMNNGVYTGIVHIHELLREGIV